MNVNNEVENIDDENHPPIKANSMGEDENTELKEEIIKVSNEIDAAMSSVTDKELVEEDIVNDIVDALELPEITSPNATEETMGVSQKSKTLHNTNQSGCKENVPNVIIFGEDLFLLLSKASSEKEGWMKCTKAMEVANGCVVQVTTQQRNEDGSYSVAEALTYVPNCRIVGDDKGRKLK